MSGNFYVPLDTKSPVSRVSSIIKTLESKVLITDRSHIETLRILPMYGFLWLKI